MTNPFGEQDPYRPPQTPPIMQATAVEEGDGTHGIIPYKNPQALIAYYLGLFSLFPCLGIILGFAALALGIRGLGAYKANPKVHGVVHAWIGIIVGGGSATLQLIFLIMVLIGASMS